MPDTTEVMDRRVAKLRDWIAADFEGNVAAFVRYYKMQRSVASYISQLFSGHRAFGEKSARKIEVDTGKPVGWLDWIEDTRTAYAETVEPAVINYDRDRVSKLPMRERQKIEEFIEFVCQQNKI